MARIDRYRTIGRDPMTLIMATPSEQDVREYVLSVVRAARDASSVVARADTAVKDRVLRSLAQAIRSRSAEVAAANGRDLAKARAAGMEPRSEEHTSELQ